MKMKMKWLIIILVVLAHFSASVIYPSIPSHLLACYRGGGPPLGAPRRLDVFLSLLRKLEANSQLDLRLFSAALLRSLRLDGIEQAANPVETEFVTPYRASAFQFHKYKLLMDLFIPSQDLLEVDEILSLHEKCLLHKMLSSTMQHWERGDENVVCPLSIEHRQRVTMASNRSRIISRCPIEEGVIQTDWGTISPGILVAAITASLEAQRVLVTDILNADVFKAGLAEPIVEAPEEWEVDIETLNIVKETPRVANADISNVWVATLAGDLAEVAVNQGPRFGSESHRMVVGSNNRWNDTWLPRTYYMLRQNDSSVDWQFTDAELLAGVDGLILAQHLPTWVGERGTLRLSQIIEMYYSNEGVAFNQTVRACNREALFTNIFDKTQLAQEVSTFAQVLSLTQGTVYVQANEMDRITDAAVTAFVNYVPTVLKQNHGDCTTLSMNVPVMDIIVATDGSWKGYDVEQFMSWLGGAVEVSSNVGSIALLHGNTGHWIAPPSDNVTALFSHISNFTDEWSNRLNFPRIMTTIIQQSQNKTLLEVEQGAGVAPSTVVLVVSPSDRLSANEVEEARDLMSLLRLSYFDVYFAYVSQEFTSFENINNEYLDYSELFIQTDSTTVQDAIKAVNLDLIKSVIPKRIIGAHCPVNDTEYKQIAYEDFVLPNRENKYRIHPYYLKQQPIISVIFRNSGQGSLLVCWWRGADATHTCQTLDVRQVHSVNITTPCPSIDFCPPVHLSVTAVTSLNLCANNDCRFPQQVGYYIQHMGLHCLALLRGSSARIIPSGDLALIYVMISMSHVLMITFLRSW